MADQRKTLGRNPPWCSETLVTLRPRVRPLLKPCSPQQVFIDYSLRALFQPMGPGFASRNAFRLLFLTITEDLRADRPHRPRPLRESWSGAVSCQITKAGKDFVPRPVHPPSSTAKRLPLKGSCLEGAAPPSQRRAPRASAGQPKRARTTARLQ